MLVKNTIVKLNEKNSRVKEELKEVFASVKGFYLKNSDSTVNSDLLIMEIGEDLDKEFKLIHNFQNSNTAGEIFLTSSLTDPDILIQSLRAGAKEFFIQPIKRDEVKEALVNFLHRRKQGNVNM